MTTEYQSEQRLTMLKKRTKRCVCKYCGHKLYLRKIIFSDFEDARVEIFCEHCGRMEFGIEPEIYFSAKYFVEEMEFSFFPDLDDNEKTKQLNIAKACEVMAWENQNIGILNQDGFTVPITANTNIFGECVVLGDDDLQGDDEIDLSKLKAVRV